MIMNSKGIIAYKLETFYWNDLTITGWFWYIFKPLLMFGSYFLMIQGVLSYINNTDTILIMTFGWTIYWYCTINIVTNARRMRRYIKLTSFSAKDALVYNLCDFILNLIVLNVLFIILTLFIDVEYTKHLIMPILLYFLTLPIFLKLGTLSVNAIDFVNGPQFIPIIILLVIKINDVLIEPFYILGIFEVIKVIFFYEIGFLDKVILLKTSIFFITALSIILYLSVNKELKYAYKDSIV